MQEAAIILVSVTSTVVHPLCKDIAENSEALFKSLKLLLKLCLHLNNR